MPTGKTGYLRALDLAFELAARRSEATKTLEEIVDKALEVAGGERGFLVVSTRKDPFAVHTAREAGGRALRAAEGSYSTTVLRNAWDMRDTVVTRTPFERLVGSRGEYELKSGTLDDLPRLRSVICSPLEVGKRMIGALVLHEHDRSEPFSIHDRLALEPLAQLAARVIAESAAQLRAEVAAPLAPTKKVAPPGGLVGSSPAVQELLGRIERVAQSEQNVLVVGETGTGKELIARLIHQKSRRAKGKLVVISMAELPAELIEAELFGHVKGSFTGALANKAGLFEEADGGTIFLDEMGELALALQGRLLRALQEKTIRRVGSAEPKRVDVRIVAATNRDLVDLAEKGDFKLDVYMRLAGLRIDVPPLRERRDDIRELVPHIIEKIAAEDGCAPKLLTEPAIKKLMRYDWPGNVRELENVLRDALVFSSSSIIDVKDVKIREKTVQRGPVLSGEIESYIHACAALRETDGDVDAAHGKLGISRATFYRWLGHGKDFDPEKRLLPESMRGAALG